MSLGLCVHIHDVGEAALAELLSGAPWPGGGSVHRCGIEVRKLCLQRIGVVRGLDRCWTRAYKSTPVKGIPTVTMRASSRKLLAAGSAGLDVHPMEWPVVLASLEC